MGGFTGRGGERARGPLCGRAVAVAIACGMAIAPAAPGATPRASTEKVATFKATVVADVSSQWTDDYQTVRGAQTGPPPPGCESATGSPPEHCVEYYNQRETVYCQGSGSEHLAFSTPNAVPMDIGLARFPAKFGGGKQLIFGAVGSKLEVSDKRIGGEPMPGSAKVERQTNYSQRSACSTPHERRAPAARGFSLGTGPCSDSDSLKAKFNLIPSGFTSGDDVAIANPGVDLDNEIQCQGGGKVFPYGRIPQLFNGGENVLGGTVSGDALNLPRREVFGNKKRLTATATYTISGDVRYDAGGGLGDTGRSTYSIDAEIDVKLTRVD
jgi:hypothetical protein